MSAPQYSKVIFHLEKDIYPPNTDLECRFELTADLQASKWDWIGIFPVAWASQREYLTYHYVPLPPDYVKGVRTFSKCKFEASLLPKKEQYYQFCYFHKNATCGVSDPFQIRISSGREYVEEECGDMLMVRPRTDVMQEEIQKLSHEIVLLTKERDDVNGKVKTVEEMIASRDNIITGLQQDVKAMQEAERAEEMKVDKLTEEIEMYRAEVKRLREEKEILEDDLRQLCKKLEDSKTQISNQKAAIRTLESNRDELSGQNQSLMDELTTYKMQVTESQTLVTQKTKTIARLNESLERAMNECSTVVEECEDLKRRLSHKEAAIIEMDQCLAQLVQDKVDKEAKQGDLIHELQNANDKLLACDAMKAKLSSDLDAYEQTQLKMNDKFERQESELRSTRDRLEQKVKECAEVNRKLEAQAKELEKKSRELQQAETSLNLSLMNIHEQAAACEDFNKKNSAVEKELSETRQQMEVVTAQLKSVMEEKKTLQKQLKRFEDELTETLVLKDKEMAVKDEELRGQAEIIEMQLEKIQVTEHQLEDLEKESAGLREKLTAKKQRMVEQTETLIETEQKVTQMSLQQQANCETIESLQKDRETYAQKYEAAQKTLEELSALKEKHREDEDARYCLWKANEALKARIEAKEKELEALRHDLKETERRAHEHFRQGEEQGREIWELKQRLELGKMEFKNKVLENQKLSRKLQKEVGRHAKRESGSSDTSTAEASLSASVSDAEGAEEASFKNLYKMVKEENERLTSQLTKESEHRTDMEQELCNEHDNSEKLRETVGILKENLREKNMYIDELETRIAQLKGNKEEDQHDDLVADGEREQSKRAQLIYGNPYAAKVEAAAEPPKLQTIIRSTLEEEAEEDDPLSAAAGEGHQLPPPLEPQVVSSQGAAASSDCEDPAAEEGAHDVFEDCPATMPADDSFLDAIGEGMKLCPICQASVMATAFEEHVTTHFGRICPVCRSQADDAMSPQDFEQHVNKCLDLEASTAPPTEETDGE